MPELPEVETIRRQLAPHVEAKRLREVEIRDPRWTQPLAADQLANAVSARRLDKLSRRGKYLIWELGGDVFLLVHLRMTGTLLLDPAGEVAHTRVVFHFDDGRRVAFVDPRRFGTGELAVGTAARDEFLDRRLGVEPFDEAFTTEHMRTLARGSRTPIKAFLLDQRKLAGVGNIYADEALFRARVHPLRQAGRLNARQWAALRDGILTVLQAGLDAKGASIDDFRHPDGVRGGFQNEFSVHRREGLPCPACGSPVRKLRAAGRGTYVCERCQIKPRQRRQAVTRSSSLPSRSATLSS